MNHDFKEIQQGDGQTKYKVTLTDEPSLTEPERNARRFLFLKDMVDHIPTGLLKCGSQQFETMTIKHNGHAWEAVLIAYETKDIYKD